MDGADGASRDHTTLRVVSVVEVWGSFRIASIIPLHFALISGPLF